MPKRSASLYKVDGRIVICANATTIGGPPLDHEPFVQLNEPVPAAALGRALKEAIAQFRDGDDSGQQDLSGAEFLTYFAQLSGFESYPKFMKNARYCAVEEEEGIASFHPMANAEGAFDSVTDGAGVETIDLGTSDEAVGHSAKAALARAC